MKTNSFSKVSLAVSLSLIVSSCSIAPNKEKPVGTVTVPTLPIQTNTGGVNTTPEGGQHIPLPSGDIIPVSMIGGTPYIPMVAIVADDDYAKIQSKVQNLEAAEKNAFLSRELETVVTALKTSLQITQTKTYPKLGFIVTHVALPAYEKLGQIKLPYSLIANPVALSQSKLMSNGKITDPRQASVGFSPLKAMGVTTFERIIQDELGVTPNGARVKVGVLDTGITLNHPTFNEVQRPVSRITYINDVSKEGRVYFHPQESITTTIQDGRLTVKANMIAPVKGEVSPDPTKFTPYESELMVEKGSPLWKALTTASGARLGLWTEKSYVGKVDLTGDGST
ncbi:MAG: hypothetical protein CMP10_07050, partial [Zetaproteobacteria bacterium]|nr:hypothetical protein [Pseudobdellovibrionaceae bacterium]